MMNLSWKKLLLDPRELRISTVLRCGQSFRWKRSSDGNVWSIGLKGRIIFLKQDHESLYYASIPKDEGEVSDTLAVIRDYFNLKVRLVDLYEDWSKCDNHFRKTAVDHLSGIRILRQDPWENLCSFICSSNNNIKRISQMVENLCIHYGNFIASHDGVDYYDFPGPEKLVGKDVEGHLRQIGFGYRAKYIQKTAEMVHEKGLDYLHGLRQASYEDAHSALNEFCGVGPKVADCVCLMSLDKYDCVPVDTHVWQIAQRDYRVAKKYKSLTRPAYIEVQEHFRRLWGEYAGWAHSVLFTADLKLEAVPTITNDSKSVVENASPATASLPIEEPPVKGDPSKKEELSEPIMKRKLERVEDNARPIRRKRAIAAPA
ncbi:N-glycosylase/DNA lyase [Trichomonascus vanleenenianus]|uniref:8-oxoguanine glycosylase OGG1 n=1 Tax=Trichomonascus vanleenenianus TaxID=2268995 RepID=UPI003ECAA6D6